MIPAILIIVFLLFSAFYSGSEMAFISVNRIRLKHRVKLHIQGAKRAEDFLSRPEKLLSTILVGNNVMLVACSSIASVYMARLLWGEGPYSGLATVLLTSLAILVFGEVIPKTLFREHADDLILWVVSPLKASYYIFIPLIELSLLISNLFLKVFKVRNQERRLPIAKKDMDILFRMGEREGAVEQQERKLITSVFEFGEIPVREAMVPRTEIAAAEKGSSVRGVIELILTTGYSRIPIYEGNMDNIVGMVHAFDLLEASDLFAEVDGFIRPVPYVPEMKSCDELFVQLRKQRSHMAIILDEYGGTAGLVTMEDLLEELVGDIFDEYDLDKDLYFRLDRRTYLIDAGAEIDHINDDLGLSIPSGDYETLGGFVIEHLGRIPEVGEEFSLKGLKIIVSEASDKKVEKVKVIT